MIASKAPSYNPASNACTGSFSSSLMSLAYRTTITTTTDILVSTDVSRTQAYWLTTPATITSDISTNTFVYYGILSAQPFVAVFKQEEIPQTVTSAPPSSTSGGPYTSTPPSNPTSSSALTIGAKAGIGVGAVLGVLLLIGLGVLFHRRRSGRPKLEDHGRLRDWSFNECKPELHNEAVRPREMDAPHKAAYVDVNSTAPVELGAHDRRE